MDDRYELFIDVQKKAGYTCKNYRKCDVLNSDVSCNYEPSEEAKASIKGVRGFWSKSINV